MAFLSRPFLRRLAVWCLKAVLLAAAAWGMVRGLRGIRSALVNDRSWNAISLETAPAMAPPPPVRGRARPRPSFLLVAFETGSGRRDYLEEKPQNIPPALGAFFSGGVFFERVYTNAVAWMPGLLSLVSGRNLPAGARSPPSGAPSLPMVLKAQGYRTAAFGAFSEAEKETLQNIGFERVWSLPHDGLDGPRLAQQAARWVDQHQSEGPYLLLLAFRDIPSDRLAPWRYWVRTAPGIFSRSGPGPSWRLRASAASLDDCWARFYQAVLPVLERTPTVLSVVSLKGWSSRPRLFRDGVTGGWIRRRSGPVGERLREEEIRVFWGLYQNALPNGATEGSAVQILDVAPTLLRLANLAVPAGWDGQGVRLGAAGKTDENEARIFIQGLGARSVIVDGHYKYVVHPRPAAVPPRRIPGDDREEIFDLWSDPGERFNIARRERTLLGRMRQVMDDASPWPVSVHMDFVNLDAPVEGRVIFGAGRILNVAGAGILRRSSSEFSFRVLPSSGSVSFDPWPPDGPYTLEVRKSGRSFRPADIRVSKLGLPLFETEGDEWHDRTKFSWMDGVPPPPAQKTPLYLLGREARRRLDPEAPVSPVPAEEPPAVAKAVAAPDLSLSTAPAAAPAVNKAAADPAPSLSTAPAMAPAVLPAAAP